LFERDDKQDPESGGHADKNSTKQPFRKLTNPSARMRSCQPDSTNNESKTDSKGEQDLNEIDNGIVGIRYDTTKREQ
jgi:hypothetical protein